MEGFRLYKGGRRTYVSAPLDRPPTARKRSVVSVTMIFAYAFNAMVVLALSATIPTSSAYVEMFTSKSDARSLSGVLVAAFNVGSAIAQPFQGDVFRWLSWNRSYPVFCLVVLVGCLVAGASYKRSIVTLFIGRLCIGFVAGNQLFERMLDASVNDIETALRILVTTVQLSYGLAFLLAAIVLSTAPFDTDTDELFPVNALTWPYYIVASIAGLLSLGSLWGLRPRGSIREVSVTTDNGPKTGVIHMSDAIIALVGMAVSFGAPGLFILGGFVINEETWRFKIVDLSLVIAGLYFVAALTIFLDRFFETPLRRTLLHFALPTLLLGVVPWKGLSTGVSFTLYCLIKPPLTISARISYTHANRILLEYANQRGANGRPSATWIVLSGVAVELGFGISVSLGTVFAPEPTGVLIVIATALLYACIVTGITYLK